MSDNEGKKTLKGWTDRERLTYLVGLLEHSAPKLDYAGAPMPVGRTAVACKLMISRLKSALKEDLERLKKGEPLTPADDQGTGVATPKAKTPRKKKVTDDGEGDGEVTTPNGRKRKAKTDADDEGQEGASPKKRGRKKKVVDVVGAETLDNVFEEAIKQQQIDGDRDDGIEI